MPRQKTTLPSAASVGLKQSHADQADYNASKKQTKLRPKPRGIRSEGSSADWHFRREADHLWVSELGREYDRNTPVGKRLLNMMVQNVLQDTGFQYNPQTGDAGLDKELKDYVDTLFADPARIDTQGEYDFHQLSKMVFRDTLAAGDIFSLFTADGPIDLRESHLCRQPFNKGIKHKNNVLGVELSENRKRLGYWFTNNPVNPLSNYRLKQSDLHFVEAWDLTGDWHTRNVLHVRDPQRISQTRGVSVFAPIFDYLGMFEDSQFQQLVKQQLSNMMLLVRERGPEFKTQNLSKRLRAGVESADWTPENDRLLEELYPGAELQGFPDEKITPWAPNIPNSEWFDHMKLVLRIMGISWGMPYVLLMLDTSDTNFHGYRGAIVEARDTFRCIQRWLANAWHTPVLEHYLHRLADEDKAIGKRRERTLREARQNRMKRFNLFNCTWTYPGWASVDDLKDAQADLIRSSNSQTSHRRLAKSQDVEWPELSREIIEDKTLHWEAGVKAAIDQLKMMVEYAAGQGIDIDIKMLQVSDIERWAERIAPLPWADRTQLSMSLFDQIKNDNENTEAPAKKA